MSSGFSSTRTTTAPPAARSVGCPAWFNSSNGGMLVENRLPFTALGGLPAMMRLGFEASSGSALQSVTALETGAPILYPGKHPKRHSVGSTGGDNRRFFQLDGNGADWGTINALVTGIGSEGSRAIRMH